MKARFYKNSAVFVVILSGMLFIGDWFLEEGQRNVSSLANHKMKSILEDHSIDPNIMIFGSSVAEGGISPGVLKSYTSKETYNAALSGRRIQDWSALAFEYLDYTENCEVIVLSVFPNSFNELQTIYFPHEFYPYLGNDHVAEALGNINDSYTKMAYIPFYKLNHINATYIQNAVDGWKVKMGSTRECFNCETGWSPPKKPDFVARDAFKIEVDTSKTVTDLYEKLIKQATAKDIQVVLVGTPVYSEGMAKFEGAEQIYSQCEIWAKQEGVHFFNYAYDEDIIHNKLSFTNNTHLNKGGAISFSNSLGDDLHKLLR